MLTIGFQDLTLITIIKDSSQESVLLLLAHHTLVKLKFTTAKKWENIVRLDISTNHTMLIWHQVPLMIKVIWRVKLKRKNFSLGVLISSLGPIKTNDFLQYHMNDRFIEEAFKKCTSLQWICDYLCYMILFNSLEFD